MTVQEEKQIEELAYMYARSLVLYGVDIQGKYESATSISMALERSYIKGRSDQTKSYEEAIAELHAYRNLGTVEELKEAREKQPKTDWILCEERLPEENTEVLINRNHNVFEISIGYYNKDFSWYDQCQCHMISDVTAWQPLPQPYKKEGAEHG